MTAPSSKPPTVALDAMGGDEGPAMVVAGADVARLNHPGVRFLLFGDGAKLEPLLAERPGLAAVSTVEHTDRIVTNDTKPSIALRSGRQSSMRLAIDAVAGGRADCVVSAGNTGALMAMAKFALKTLPGIDRPAIASFFPTERGETVMLDLGANIECDADNLVQFALMGAVFCKAVLGYPSPTIGLLNVGAEELKGHDELREAAARLRSMDLPGRFHGFVEGDDITRGTVDVVVTDGFTGNVALKTAEGTAKLVSHWLRQTFKSSVFASLGYLLAANAFRKLKARTDPRRYNGAMFVGLRGICVKSHGGTDAKGFGHAIDVAVDLAIEGFSETVRMELARYGTPPHADEGIPPAADPPPSEPRADTA